MIFLPNTFERYIAALRVLNHLLILKNGITSKRLKTLKKIYTAEAFYFRKKLSPFSITDFTLSLVSASQTLLYKKGKTLNFSLNTKGNYLFNKQLYTLLILEICSSCNYMKITEKDIGIVIFINGEIKNSLPFIKKLKGYYFYENSLNKAIIILPFEKTALTPITNETEWYYLFDKFSPVNLYFL